MFVPPTNLSLPASWRSQRGFTLLEILVVMVILGVLVSVAAGSFISSQQKGRDTRRKHDLGQIANALEAYYNDKGQYPTSSGGVMYGCGAEGACAWGEVFQDEKGTVYMVQLPDDPRGRDYYYEAASDGSSYQLYAFLENTRDIAITKDESGDPLSYTGTSCGATACNYGISSANTLPITNHPLGN